MAPEEAGTLHELASRLLAPHWPSRPPELQIAWEARIVWGTDGVRVS